MHCLGNVDITEYKQLQLLRKWDAFYLGSLMSLIQTRRLQRRSA